MRVLVTTVVVVLASSLAHAVNIDLVTVGNPGNAPDTRYETPGYGGVAYTYNIGKYEVTHAQYCEFLNAVAKTDTHRLYNTSMGDVGGGITRTGSDGSYAYSVIQGRGNKPVNCVIWGDAVRFANWMHNGQPTGAQDLSTTEDGSYYLNGAMSIEALQTVTRKANAMWVIPSENEWYKAAYYKGGGIDAGYWDYPTQSNTAPRAEGPPGTNTTNGSANYNVMVNDLTDIGAYTFKPSDSAYGTFDQGGNVFEWNETKIGPWCRSLRGGSYADSAYYLLAAHSFTYPPGYTDANLGFRVAEIPEPATVILLLAGGLELLRRRSRR